MGPDAQYCADQVRRADHDRYLATLYAPAPVRPALFALHALDVEMASVVDSTTEPMLGEIRLAWWRESLQKLDVGVVPAQPVLATLAAQRLSGAALETLEDAYLAVLSGAAFESVEQALAYGEARGATLFEQALRLLQPDAASDAVAAVRSAGRAWALVDLMRHGPKDDVRAIVAAAAGQALASVHASAGAVPASARPLLALTRLARRDFEADGPGGAIGRQVQLLWGVISGRP